MRGTIAVFETIIPQRGRVLWGYMHCSYVNYTSPSGKHSVVEEFAIFKTIITSRGECFVGVLRIVPLFYIHLVRKHRWEPSQF